MLRYIEENETEKRGGGNPGAKLQSKYLRFTTSAFCIYKEPKKPHLDYNNYGQRNYKDTKP
jgi:hypothetical protein